MVKIEKLLSYSVFGVTTFLLMKWFDNILLYITANIVKTLKRNLKEKKEKNNVFKDIFQIKVRKLIVHDLNQRTSKGLETPKR